MIPNKPANSHLSRILYERLTPPTNSPPPQDRVGLPMSAPSGVPPMSAAHHHREALDQPPASAAEADQHYSAYQEFNSRSRPAPLPIEGRPPIDSLPGHSPHMPVAPSPRDHHRMAAPRHGMGPFDPHPSRSHSSHASPPIDHDYPPPTRHIRTRSQSSSRSRTHQMPSSSYREGQYPEMQPQAFSPPLSAEHERSRHSDMRSMPPQPDAHGHLHHGQLSPRSANSDLRSRMHPHQRVGPGTYINRDEYPERQRDLDRDREWEQERSTRDIARNREIPPAIHSPHAVNRHRQPIERADYADHHMSSARDEQPHYYEGAPPPSRTYPLVSRSGTPGSGSASGSGGGLNEDSSRPDSHSQYYDQQDRTRPPAYRVRTAPGQQEDIEFTHEDARLAAPSHSRTDRLPGGGGTLPLSEQNLPLPESRKRSRNEMDIDSENDVVDTSRDAGPYSSSRTSVQDRGSKRYHRERPHRRSMDAGEDNRVVPS